MSGLLQKNLKEIPVVGKLAYSKKDLTERSVVAFKCMVGIAGGAVLMCAYDNDYSYEEIKNNLIMTGIMMSGTALTKMAVNTCLTLAYDYHRMRHRMTGGYNRIELSAPTTAVVPSGP